jgi:hypothetical protein
VPGKPERSISVDSDGWQGRTQAVADSEEDGSSWENEPGRQTPGDGGEDRSRAYGGNTMADDRSGNPIAATYSSLTKLLEQRNLMRGMAGSVVTPGWLQPAIFISEVDRLARLYLVYR